MFVPCYPEVISGHLGSVPGTWSGMVIGAVWVVMVVAVVMGIEVIYLS